MRTWKKAILLSGLLAFGQPLLAQEASEGDQGLAIGEPVATEPKITTETVGDWTIRCRAETGTEQCELYQVLKDQNGNPVIEVFLFPLKEQGAAVAGGSIIVPLETLLTSQLNLAVDDSLPKRYPFAFCHSVGCVSRVGLTQDDIDAFKKGSVAKLSIVPAAAPDQVVSLNMSLSGFTKAFNQIAATE
jgi:invasion protein IalB